MAVYSVEGKLGTGKTKFAVWRAKLALLEGRRVASNVDLHLGDLLPRRASRYVRLPDKPTDFDLDAAGHGNPDSYDEDRNGVMILDELGTWLNARSFQDKSRAGLIDWLIHARKKGWDVYLIVQDAGMIDRQVREALIEYQCRCLRLDKVKIPGVSFVAGVVRDLAQVLFPASWCVRLKVQRWGYLPRMHLVTARVGTGQTAVVAERWMYRGDELHKGYDTRQAFSSSYPHGAHSVWVQPLPARPSLGARVRAWWASRHARPALKPKRPEVQALASLPAPEAWRRAVELSSAAPRS